MKKSMAFLTALAAATLVTSDLTAQEPAAAESTLLGEAVKLNRTLAQIASLLEKHVESRDTELLIKRIELSSGRLGPMKERLRQARAELTNLGDEEVHLVGMLEAQKEEAARKGEAAEANLYEAVQLEQIELRLEALPERKRELGREILELENDVAVQEEDLKVLEDAIDSRLGLR